MVAPTPHLPPVTNVLALPADTLLAGDYRIKRVLGAGGFGITYLARDLVLDRAVTIKEYFPVDFAARGGSNDAIPRSEDSASDYQWGLDRFIEEAKALAQFDHPNIVKVYRYFQENSTAYMVLQFEEGRSLKAWQKALRRAPRQTELDAIAGPLLESLDTIHQADFLHRDIAPDNIIIREDNSPVLIDFGSARGDIARHSRTVSALVKPGYSPYEQYAEIGSQQGPWTDIYALGATLYHVVTGKRPPDSPSRIVKDDYVSARAAAVGSYRPRFLDAIDHALKLDIDRRPKSIAQWRGGLLAPEDKPAAAFFRRKTQAKAAKDLAPTVKLTEAPVAADVLEDPVPPPPDAPGQHGGFLDFLDGLRPKRTRALGAAAAKSKSLGEALEGVGKGVAQPPAVASAAPVPAAASASVEKSINAEAEPAVKKSNSKARRRPRAVRGNSGVRATRSRRWRPLAIKLLIGIGVATLAVSYQNQISNVASLSTATQKRSHTPKRIVAAPKLPAPFHAHDGGARAVAFANHGREVVSTGLDGTIKRWNAIDGKLLGSIALDNGPATSIAVRDNRILSGHGNGAISLWNSYTGDKVAGFKHNQAAVWSVAFAGGSSRFVAASHDWKIRLWDAGSASAPLHIFEDHKNAVQAVGATTAGSLFVSGGADKTVKLWDLTNLDLVRTYRGHKDFVTAVAISDEGQRIAGANLKGRIRLWSTRSKKLLRSFGQHDDRVTGLTFSPDGKMLASASGDGTVRLWLLARRRAVRAFAAGAAVNSVAFSPDGRSIVAATADGKLRFWAIPADDAEND